MIDIHKLIKKKVVEIKSTDYDHIIKWNSLSSSAI